MCIQLNLFTNHIYFASRIKEDRSLSFSHGLMLSEQERPSRKRPRDLSTHANNEKQPSRERKRQKYSSYYSPRFWDTLSKVPLTRGALREFDRRTVQSSSALAERASITRRRLRSDTGRLLQFASKGGPDLSNLRGYSDRNTVDVTMSLSSFQRRKRSHASSTSRSSATGRTKSTTPYNGEFEQKLIDRGIYPKGYRTVDGRRPPKPNNLSELCDILGRPRPSLSPSVCPEAVFEEFQDNNERASSELKAMADVIPFITGNKDKQHETSGDVSFNRLQKFDPELSAPKPDMYYGAQPAQINARVRRDLNEFIIPSNRTDLPAVPNFFLEGKSASGKPDVAQRQATYNGAVGARGILQLQNYGSTKHMLDGNAYTISATYHAGTGTLQMYATHPRESTAGETDYYMTQVDGYYMIGTSENFRKGAAAFRNAREWTQQQRDRFIAEANATVLEMSAGQISISQTGSNTEAPSIAVGLSFSSEKSTDELALEDAINVKRPRPAHP